MDFLLCWQFQMSLHFFRRWHLSELVLTSTNYHTNSWSPHVLLLIVWINPSTLADDITIYWSGWLDQHSVGCSGRLCPLLGLLVGRCRNFSESDKQLPHWTTVNTRELWQSNQRFVEMVLWRSHHHHHHHPDEKEKFAWGWTFVLLQLKNIWRPTTSNMNSTVVPWTWNSTQSTNKLYRTELSLSLSMTFFDYKILNFSGRTFG